MFDNIGKKLKGLAKWTFIVEAIAAIIGGIIVIVEEDEVIGLLLLFLGPVIAWISSWVLYAFGELVDKACDIERNMRNRNVNVAIKSDAQTQKDNKRIAKLEKLRAEGLITEEEFQEAIAKGE